MNKREYLRSIGFTVGERGRFNDAMKTALAKYDGVFDEDNPNILDKTNKSKLDVVKKVVHEKQREPRQLFGFTQDGIKVGFITCSNCNQHMIWCDCKEGIHAPSLVKYSKDSLVFVRQV